MSADAQSFTENFFRLTGYSPMRWQRRLFHLFMDGKLPTALDLPTGLGKTSVMAIWLIARAHGAPLPRRLVYGVDRRAVVDQATDVAETLCDALDCNVGPESMAGHLKGLQLDEKERAFTVLRALKKRLGVDDEEKLPISTLRGAHVDNREWLNDPGASAIIVGTVDMIGSRLLFEGYGVSRKMRPYHAGFLGADTLIVLDEAHLVPPFASLLRAIEGEISLWPKDRRPLPRLVVLPLSATQRERPAENDGRKPFGLEEEDWCDSMASQRLNARKQLSIEPPAEKDHDKLLAEAAFELATKGRPARVVVFCNRRERKDDGAGPSAQGVSEAIKALASGDKKAGREKIDIDLPELLVGARRVHEREQVARKLQELGFTGRAEPPERPAFLVATSAGEVGVDLDADDMVCDLAPWERMVQRLGRVNRRGGEGRAARVIVFDTSRIEKDEARKARLIATCNLLSRIETDFDGEAGPATLLELRRRAGREEIEKASTPEPLHPALTRALIDAWSMTSLETHTGRPDIAPWLRGWVETDLQTTVIWRSHLPVRERVAGWPQMPVEKKEIEAFFEAAPPHESEKLETETYRVAEWLHNRANALLKRVSPTAEGQADSEDTDPAIPEIGSNDLDQDEAQPATPEARTLRHGDIVAIALSPDGRYAAHYALKDLARERKGRAKDDFLRELVGKVLVVDVQFSGLIQGMLKADTDDSVETADGSAKWSKAAKFRVRLVKSDDDDGKEEDWPFEDDFVLRRDDDDNPVARLIVEHYKDAAQSEDARSVSQPQALGEHQSWAEQKARCIAAKIGLSGIAAEALAVAAFLHDEGKRASRWQRAFRAPHERDEVGAYKIFAKTRGPINQQILDGYRHEFGSLPYAEDHARFKALPEDWRDLVLHLIAAHHGQARPLIATRGCEDAPPSALEERARDVALQFARLQKRWGPWGLAWWEALLRAADQQASRDNDADNGRSGEKI